jgi:prenyltransferase beta subunit
MRMKQPDGSFTMHEGGEVDVRYVFNLIFRLNIRFK